MSGSWLSWPRFDTKVRGYNRADWEHESGF